MKIFNDKNVYDASIERIDIVLQEFDHVYLSVSGGKDSSLMLQLVADRARRLGKTIDVLFIDLEAQYQATITHMEELRAMTADVTDTFYWVALPISLRNAVSVIQPKWTCWDPEVPEKWVRPMPEGVITMENQPFPFFRPEMEFEDFILLFAEWYQEQKGGTCAAGIGIRTDESLNRFRTIVSEKKVRYKDYPWTTKINIGAKSLDVYNFYPIYDWATADVWGAVSKHNMRYNEIYELMYKNGLSIHEQRLCQPYGDDQRNGLDQFKALEYETWEKVLNRVHGVNFGNIYCRTSLLGNLKTEKPEGMNWEEYTVFLLESIGLYAPELRDHYYKKIRTFLNWYEKERDQKSDEIPDEEDRKLESSKKVASWRRVARAIERNDFWMSRLSFAQTKRDVERMKELKQKYRNLIYAEDTDSKPLKRIAKELNQDDYPDHQ